MIVRWFKLPKPRATPLSSSLMIAAKTAAIGEVRSNLAFLSPLGGKYRKVSVYLVMSTVARVLVTLRVLLVTAMY